MSRFFVGQRVRLVRSETGRLPVGIDGVIAEIDFGFLTMDGPADCRVRWDAFSGNWWADFDQLEPILPDGHRACDEEFKRDLDKLLEGLPA